MTNEESVQFEHEGKIVTMKLLDALNTIITGTNGKLIASDFFQKIRV